MRSGCRGRRPGPTVVRGSADYVIQRSSNGGGSWRTVADGASTSRNVHNQRPDQRHPLPLPRRRQEPGRCRRMVGERPQRPRPPVREVPRSLTAERGGNHAVRLSWQAPRSNGGASIADYVIQRSSNGGGSWRTVADGASTSRNVTIGGLTNGTRYHFPRRRQEPGRCRRMVGNGLSDPGHQTGECRGR